MSVYVFIPVVAMQVKLRKPSPNVTTKTVGINYRAPSSPKPAIHRRRRGPDYGTAARVACWSYADTGRNALHQPWHCKRPDMLLRRSSTLVVEPARKSRGIPGIRQARIL